MYIAVIPCTIIFFGNAEYVLVRNTQYYGYDPLHVGLTAMLAFKCLSVVHVRRLIQFHLHGERRGDVFNCMIYNDQHTYYIYSLNCVP